jgi:hypothetical protein
MEIVIDEHSVYFLYGVCAFNFCLIMATLLFVFYLWLDIYHNRHLKKLDEIETMIEKMRLR